MGDRELGFCDEPVMTWLTVRQWMARFAPCVYGLLRRRATLSDKQVVWVALVTALDVGTVLYPDSGEGMMEAAWNLMRCGYYGRYQNLNVASMLGIHGYGNIQQRAKGGSYAVIVDIGSLNGYAVSHVGKLVSGLTDRSPNCMVEATVSKIPHPRINRALEIMTTSRYRDGRWDPMHCMCIVQERMPSDVSQRLTQEEKASVYVSPATTLQRAMDVTEGLWVMHRRMWVHMDMKPSNLLVSPSGRVTLTDFGLSYRHTTQAGACGLFVTIWYRPPELALTLLTHADGDTIARTGPAVDMWSLGMILWDFLCVRPLVHKAGTSDTLDGMWRMMDILMDVLGAPSESAIRSWKLPPECGNAVRHRVAVRDLPVVPRQTLLQHSRPHWRSCTRLMSDRVREGWFAIVRGLLTWGVRRPTAASVWEDLKALGGGVITRRVHKPSPSVITQEEVEWRVAHVSREHLNAWWSRAEGALRILIRTRPAGVPPFLGRSRGCYLDTLTLACELVMRFRFRCSSQAWSEEDPLTTDACVSLAVQMTRPWWDVQCLREMWDVSDRLTVHGTEMYVAYTLHFNMYTDNLLTRHISQAPHDIPPYDRFRSTYMSVILSGHTT